MDKSDKPHDESTAKVFDFVKKVVTAGLGAAFMTEESVRSYLSDIKLPKDVVAGLVQGANKSKEELMARVGDEAVKVINKIDFVKEASRFVEEHKFRVTAEIDVVRKVPRSESSDSSETLLKS